MAGSPLPLTTVRPVSFIRYLQVQVLYLVRKYDTRYWYGIWYTSASRRGRFRPLRLLTRKKNGTKQTVQTIRGTQAVCKCQELHAPSRIGPERRMPYVRTYMSQVLVGYIFFFRCMLFVRTRKRSTAEQHHEKQLK